MAPSELLTPRGVDAAAVAAATLAPVTLTADDIGAALALSDAAGWNQIADDWAVFIGHGHAIGLRDATGALVATAAALPYAARGIGGHRDESAPGRGWVSMVLVAEAWRHRGLASHLLGDAVSHLCEAGLVPVLDATPAGAAVYRQNGFEPGLEVDRWEGPSTGAATSTATATSIKAQPDDASTATRRATLADLDAIAELDRAATGLDRRFLLESFLSRADTTARLSADGRGFVIARSGRRARQVGPLVGADDAQAIALLHAALASATAGERVFLDLARPRRALAAWLEARGFTRQRPFVRMALAAPEPPALGPGAYLLAGPEFG